MTTNTILYHGSNQVVEHPDIHIRGYEKDFGYGFYCTLLEKQARKWALTKRPAHVVNIYAFHGDGECKVKRFATMTEEWLDFILACRQGGSHRYDIVEGPMADDTIWNFIEDYVSGVITREQFWVLAKFKHPTHQIVFCSQKALQCITFQDSYTL